MSFGGMDHLNAPSHLRKPTNESTHPLPEAQRPSQTLRLHTRLGNAVHRGRAASEAGGCTVEEHGTVDILAAVDNVGWGAIG